jgi:predicted dehydrogenase
MIRVGLIGCGGNMRAHLRRLVTIPEVQIVGIVEPSEENVRLAKEQFRPLEPVAVFCGHREMLAALQPDAVEISTPHTLHFEQIMDSLEAGCHVLCEKPMTCTRAEAETVCKRAEETGKVVMVSYQRHQQALYR